jgi:uncharacterized DUF497 family protein
VQRRFDLIRWSPGRTLHIARHGVTPEETEEALFDERNQLWRRGDGRYLLYGRTDAGRRLLLVLEDEGEGVAAPVTARDVTDRERRTYFAHR